MFSQNWQNWDTHVLQNWDTHILNLEKMWTPMH